MLKQTNLTARFCKIRSKVKFSMRSQINGNLVTKTYILQNCWEESQVSPYQFSMACKMWFGFQFNLSDSSDDDLYRLDFDPESQGHQIKATSGKLSLYSWDHILVHQKNQAGGALG